MKIGNIQANQGERAFGFFSIGVTHGRFPIHIPLHLLVGAEDGPTLVVQAGASGLEIEPALILPHVANELDPAQMKGNLILAPLMNTSAFEFEQVHSAWDGKHYNEVGRGRADGSVSEQLVHSYFNAAIAKADALLDIRTGALSSYHEFVGVNDEGDVEGSKALAIALGLPQVVLGKDEDNSMAQEAARDGKAVAVAFIGGGPGLRDYRDQNLGRMRNAVLNAMRHLGMLDGEHRFRCGLGERHSGTHCHYDYQANVALPLWTRISAAARWLRVKRSATFAIRFLGNIWKTFWRRARVSWCIAGAAWPVPEEDTILAILGDLLEEIAIA